MLDVNYMDTNPTEEEWVAWRKHNKERGELDCSYFSDIYELSVLKTILEKL